MATLIYAPAIRVHVQSSKLGIIDISDDISQWQLIRRTNTVSSFNFTLQNTQRKYDGVFRPSDRITVELKRVTWVRVFTGSLNNSAVFSSWPRSLPMSASCTLKKLQFWPWDPTTLAANGLVQKWLTSASGASTLGDSGISNLIADSLTKVTGWSPQQIHIGAVPNQWFGWARKTEQDINTASTMASILGSGSTIGGASGNYVIQPGTYGGQPFSASMVAIANEVYAVIIAQKELNTAALVDAAALVSFITIDTENTSWDNPPGGDRDSIGIFQQRPSQGWGPAASISNVAFATESFLGKNPAVNNNGLLKINGWQNLAPWVAAQAVQNSYAKDGSNYEAKMPVGKALVAAFRSAQNNSPSTNPINGGLPTGASPQVGAQTIAAGTGANLANVAYHLIADRAPGTIRYSQSGVSPENSQNPTVLDCSSLAQWCYYHATNGKSLGQRISEYQYSLCDPISLAEATSIQGALLFGEFGVQIAGLPDHVGVSLGNGNHVAAHTDEAPLAQQVNISPTATGGFSSGGLLRTIDYSNAATNATGLAAVTRVTKKAANISTVTLGGGPALNPASADTSQSPTVVQQLITAVTTAPQASGNLFGGPRELINNSPFLPWLTNVCNSSMRAFSSAPNGDFIAWFPDYFGVWGTAGIMDIQLIELQDFTVDWSDQQIVTHEFVLGSLAGILDGTSGNITDGSDPSWSGLGAMLGTEGVATMDFPQIFEAIYGKAASSSFVNEYLQRFGARPNLEQMPNIAHGDQEFFMALWKFMYYWAAQFNATVPMTFMPELWPGMLLQIPDYNFQAYVTEVTHSGSYGQNGQFTTEATIVAPTNISGDRASLFGVLDF